MKSVSREKPVDLAFSNKYDEQHALRYHHKHAAGVWRRLSHWRDEQLARQALHLAGDPQRVLDLPCGAGRFWPLLCEQPGREIIAADNSKAMLEVAQANHPAAVYPRIRTLQTSAFAIDLADEAVDCIFCMRLLHHVGDANDRQRLLRELHRVTRDSLIISLWVDGNFKAWKRRRLEQRRRAREYQNRFVLPAALVEDEFRWAGFEIQQSIDFAPRYAMWRVYLLRKRG